MDIPLLAIMIVVAITATILTLRGDAITRILAGIAALGSLAYLVVHILVPLLLLPSLVLFGHLTHLGN